MYRVVPYLLIAAPPAIVLLSILLGSCTATRLGGDRAEQAGPPQDPDSRTGEALVNRLERRESRVELQRIIDEAQR